jgi:hypothetical protein
VLGLRDGRVYSSQARGFSFVRLLASCCSRVVVVSCAEQENPPRSRDAFQVMDSVIQKGETRVGGKLTRGARDQDVSGVPERHDASRLVDRQPSYASRDHLNLSGVDPGPDVEADATDRGTDFQR